MNDPLRLKQEVHRACSELVRMRIRAAEEGMRSARESGLSETKSSAGDKHETARAMIHQELEKQAAALNDLHRMADELARIDPDRPCTRILPGALVSTDIGLLYVSVALGKVEVDGRTVLAISAQAPLLAALNTIVPGGECTANGRTHRLLAIA